MSHVTRTPNRLAREKSPYLLQHAGNPVDWYPWGSEAFERARRENRPVFLSIGYSTCHWCHVMERESFEDDEVAALLNDGFVCVKVDREERPDVDRIYMTALQALGAGGGWPLTCFLTPEGAPFFGGTYMPPRASHGRPGLVEILPRVLEAWRDEPSALADTGRRVFEALAESARASGPPAAHERLFASAAETLAGAWDRTHGGFGMAPKFPSASNLGFLLRWWVRDRERHADALAMVTSQLDAMAAGGIHDHVGGGFHRYATRRDWNVPHFEKMLYDQAQLVWIYLEAHQATGSPRYAAVAGRILEYVTRDLTLPGGAFASAEDADSEGEEGRFYVWTPTQLADALPAPAAALFASRYGVTGGGNFERGTSALHEAMSLADAAAAHGLDPVAAGRLLDAACVTLLATRARRPRPHRDDKVITAWNGLMISAFARGAVVLGRPVLASRAADAAKFVWTHLAREQGGRPTLARRWRDGEAAAAGQLDDHAALALGLLDLALATHDPMWLDLAVRLASEMLARFDDPTTGGLFESPGDDPTVALRLKDGYDGAELAGNSLAALVLWRLAMLLERDDFRSAAERSFAYHAERLTGNPVAMPMMLAVMERAGRAPRHVVVTGTPGAADTRALLGETARRFLPHDEVLLKPDGEDGRAWAGRVPFVTPLVAREGHATAYVCVDRVCRLPVTDPERFGEALDEPVPMTDTAGGS
ncbi:MAG TPA: thioredoxin domain-containing protein [Dongiaceae bacterium]|nr:thioredoxin domain-containing protein [Dongiaceae bacterium]